jgi:glycerol-3-phosphate acyltransferase PlsY
MTGAFAVVIAYLLGSIPFGLLIAKIMAGADVRNEGSGNIGATNVLRTAGRLAGILTLILDAGKGLLAVWLAGYLTGRSSLWMSLAALAVLLGHAFPVWLKFKGGKAVATCIGALGYLTPLPILAVVLIFVAVVAWTHYLSLGSILAAGLYPLACWLIVHPDWPIMLASMAAAILIVERHRGNIQRIRAGDERIFRFQREGR